MVGETCQCERGAQHEDAVARRSLLSPTPPLVTPAQHGAARGLAHKQSMAGVQSPRTHAAYLVAPRQDGGHIMMDGRHRAMQTRSTATWGRSHARSKQTTGRTRNRGMEQCNLA